MAEEILYRKENGIGIITLNRPEKRNAMTWQMNRRFGEISEEVKRDGEVRVLIITGTGSAFSSGTDVSPAGGGSGTDSSAAGRNAGRLAGRLNTLERFTTLWGLTNVPKPVIAAINGAAVGLGAEFTLHCDFRIAAESARWGQIFVMRGWVPDTGAGTYLLSRIVGLSKAMELVFSGEIINAQEMARIGLVSRVVPDAQLMPASIEMAKRMMRGAPLAVKAAKELMYRALERNLEEHLNANSLAFGALTSTEDHAEGVRAFLEKREPRWQGR